MLDLLLLTSALTLSIYNTLTFLWLGLTVLLMGEKGRWTSRLGALGLLLCAVFFVSHSMIIGRGATDTGSGMEFWWRLGWLPTVGAPLVWYAIMIRYADLPPRRRRLHLALLAAMTILGATIVLLLLGDNPFASFSSLVVGAAPAAPGGLLSSILSLPRLVISYLGFALLCYLLPLVAFYTNRPLPRPVTLSSLPVHRRARPWLIAVNVCLALASVGVAAMAAWAIQNALPLLSQDQLTRRYLFGGDTVIMGLIAIAVILLGRAIVAYEVFTEKPLPRRSFFNRWRSVVISFGIAAGLISVMAIFQFRPIYALSLLGFLATIAYALLTWQAYLSHEKFVANLTPFVGSLNLPARLLSPTASAEFAEEAERLFTALCRDAISATRACLLLDGDPPRTIAYHWSHSDLPTFPTALPAEPTWVDEGTLLLPLADSPGTGGALFLGPKSDGTLYMSEEIQLALACGERIRDTATGEQITRTLMNLLRQRLTQLKVLSARHKRVLHDEALPDLHLALLKLEAARSHPDPQALATAADALAKAHRTLAALLRETLPLGNRALAEQGLYAALREAVEREFASEFDSVTWNAPPDVTARLAESDAGIAGEVLYYAALEAVRNSARHARGGRSNRPLHLTLRMDWPADFRLVVSDDGVGLSQLSHPVSSNGGAGEGLLFHSTMVAVVGGRLTASSQPGQGTKVELTVPLPPLTADADRSA